MAHRSAMGLVLAQWLPVNPSKGGQPAYYRSKHAVQTSGRLKRFQGCVAGKMAGKKFTDREAVKNAFKGAVRECAGK
ncbi:MAG: hypothetical protein PHU95_00715 [Candidatus Thermoplasmatota archaeon]|nr:hypothetical protein [Candidatus Thermoplasmatota archaeon]MDD5777959.1 hypothetical protein [Candidatus Thermoplasmatota archaeon]